MALLAFLLFLVQSLLLVNSYTCPLGTPDNSNCSLHPREPVAKNLDYPDKSKPIFSRYNGFITFLDGFRENLKIDFLHYATSVDHHLSCNILKYGGSKKGSYFGSMDFVSKFYVHPLPRIGPI